MAFQRIHDIFRVPKLLDAKILARATSVDEISILAYLVEFIKAVGESSKYARRQTTPFWIAM